MKILKQSTSATIKLGPFLDATDGVTAETGLTIAQADVILFKNFGAGASKNESTTATHDTGGWYGVPLNTTDTGTLGHLQIHVNESGACPVWEHYMVVPANVYDSLIAGTDLVDVSLVQINGATGGVLNLAESTLAIIRGTSDNTAFTATTSIMDTTITEATADHYNGRVIVFTSGALLGQAARISDYALTSGRGRFTFVDALTEAVPNSSTFVIA
jgi:hypothetical protein